MSQLLDDITQEKLNNFELKLEALKSLVDETKKAQDSNAKLLEEIKEILDMSKGFFKFLGIIATGLKWFAAVGTGAAAIWAFIHGRPPV